MTNSVPVIVLLLLATSLDLGAQALVVEPAQVRLRGRAARQQLLVSLHSSERRLDRTREARYGSADPRIAKVDEHGLVTASASGETEIVVTVDGAASRVRVVVKEGEVFLPVTFERHVQAALTRGACNSGACHGKQRGQNGFQLSLLGFDDDFDYDSIVRDSRARRVFPASPERSLLLLKPTARLAHGGGRRLKVGGRLHDTIRRWIAAGMPRRAAGAATIKRIEVLPPARLMAPRTRQQLVVTAHFSDGTREDVTHLTAFQSNESPIAAVDEHGLVRTGPLAGEAAIMARYMGKFATATISIPMPGDVPDSLHESLPRRNFVDDLVWRKLRRLGITPSATASDARFLRRAHIDIIGRLPTPDEVRTFLADDSPNKRDRLVDALLARPEYADHWANKWVDLLRPNPYRAGIKAVRSLDSWVRRAFRENRPYDQFVTDLVTAQGSTFRHGAATVFRDRRSPDELVTMFSQLFLGIRLGCAKCHQHPFEVWSQEDYYSLAAYFADVGRKGSGLSPPISGGEEFVYVSPGGKVHHPRTGKLLEARPLFGEAPPIRGERIEGRDELREALATWMSSPRNPFFARVIVNRVWADLMGRGLVEPVDDLRESNPPTNEPLLEALAERFRTDGHDLKKLLRVIATSHVYGLSSAPTERNVSDTRNHSRYLRRRLRAEVLLDAVCDITGVPETYAAMPAGSRAAELWTHRTSSVFLDAFGRPDPNQDPPCFRIEETTVVQALHLMNSPRLNAKVSSDTGRAARLATSALSPGEIVEEIYLLVYSRFPTADERRSAIDRIARAAQAVAADDAAAKARHTVVEDLLWALLNTPEFVFKN